MKILAVGGGSGGHVTPVVAVLNELKQWGEPHEIRFWVDRGFASQARSIMRQLPDIKVDVIASGRFRRYHHVPMWRQLLWPSVVVPNLIDGFKVVAGALQSLYKLVVWRPDVVFTKGGFVCLPVGWAANILRIPLVIHDSDAHPGLTNRILARWATSIATGAPLKYYTYPKERSRYVGIPISAEFTPVSDSERLSAKEALGFDASLPLVVVTGGGLGATRINDAVMKQKDTLTTAASVVLLSGKANYDELRLRLPHDETHFRLEAFSSEMAQLLRAADVVVARAGATTILELAALEMPTILVPNARLTGGHQVKNAAVYQESEAVVLIDEDAMTVDSSVLSDAIRALLGDPQVARAMGQRFGAFARPQAAHDMAVMIEQAAKNRGR